MHVLTLFTQYYEKFFSTPLSCMASSVSRSENFLDIVSSYEWYRNYFDGYLLRSLIQYIRVDGFPTSSSPAKISVRYIYHLFCYSMRFLWIYLNAVLSESLFCKKNETRIRIFSMEKYFSLYLNNHLCDSLLHSNLGYCGTHICSNLLNRVLVV